MRAAPRSPTSVCAVLEAGRGTTTDVEGKFTLAELPSGTYGVAFSRIGYAPLGPTGDPRCRGRQPRTLDACIGGRAAGGPGDGECRAPPRRSRRHSRRASWLGITCSVAPGALPSARLSTGSAGVHSIDEGPAIGKPVIRGLELESRARARQRQRIETQGWGDEHSPNVETADAERIEVIRGPASVLYGSDALGGVINVVKRDLPDAIGRAPFVGGAGVGAPTARTIGQPDGTARLEGASRRTGIPHLGDRSHQR